MNNELAPIDITRDRDLLRLVEEVRRSGRSRRLRRGDEDVAVLSPIPDSESSGGPSEAAPRSADDPFLAAAGGWKGLIDPDELKQRIQEERSHDRPPLEL